MAGIHNIRGLYDTNIKKTYDKLSFEVGEEFLAKIVSMDGGENEILLRLLDGWKFPAKLKNPLEFIPEGLLKFEVEGFEDGKINIKIVNSGKQLAGNKDYIEEFLLNNNMNVSEKDYDILNNMVKHNIPLTKENIVDIKTIVNIREKMSESENIDEFINKYLSTKGIDEKSVEAQNVSKILKGFFEATTEVKLDELLTLYENNIDITEDNIKSFTKIFKNDSIILKDLVNIDKEINKLNENINRTIEGTENNIKYSGENISQGSECIDNKNINQRFTVTTAEGDAIPAGKEINNDESIIVEKKLIDDDGNVIVEKNIVIDGKDQLSGNKVIDDDGNAILEKNIVTDGKDQLSGNKVIDDDGNAILEKNIVTDGKDQLSGNKVIDDDGNVIVEKNIVTDGKDQLSANKVIDDDRNVIVEKNIVTDGKDQLSPNKLIDDGKNVVLGKKVVEQESLVCQGKTDNNTDLGKGSNGVAKSGGNVEIVTNKEVKAEIINQRAITLSDKKIPDIIKREIQLKTGEMKQIIKDLINEGFKLEGKNYDKVFENIRSNMNDFKVFNSISNQYYYLDLPVNVDKYGYQCKLIIKDQRGKGKKIDTKNVKIAASVKTINMGVVDAFIKVDNNLMDIQIKCDKPWIKKIQKDKDKLIETLGNSNYNIYVKVDEKQEEFNMPNCREFFADSTLNKVNVKV